MGAGEKALPCPFASASPPARLPSAAALNDFLRRRSLLPRIPPSAGLPLETPARGLPRGRAPAATASPAPRQRSPPSAGRSSPPSWPAAPSRRLGPASASLSLAWYREGVCLSRLYWQRGLTCRGMYQWLPRVQIRDRRGWERNWLGERGVPPAGTGVARSRRLKMAAAARSGGRFS